MKKSVNIIWKVVLILVIGIMFVGSGVLFVKRDELITSNITMDYFEETINEYNEDRIKNFVAKSDNDVLYNNFVSTMKNVYYYEGVSDFEFEITNFEKFGEGKYQCYLSTSFENYVPKCDLENEGRYMNYLVDIKVKYILNEEEKTHNEKGLVVFVKDMEKGNYFTWKLVRFDRYKVVTE